MSPESATRRRREPPESAPGAPARDGIQVGAPRASLRTTNREGMEGWVSRRPPGFPPPTDPRVQVSDAGSEQHSARVPIPQRSHAPCVRAAAPYDPAPAPGTPHAGLLAGPRLRHELWVCGRASAPTPGQPDGAARGVTGVRPAARHESRLGGVQGARAGSEEGGERRGPGCAEWGCRGRRPRVSWALRAPGRAWAQRGARCGTARPRSARLEPSSGPAGPLQAAAGAGRAAAPPRPGSALGRTRRDSFVKRPLRRLRYARARALRSLRREPGRAGVPGGAGLPAGRGERRRRGRRPQGSQRPGS